MKVKGIAAQFLNPNTDTDIIIPAKFLKRTSLDGFEQFAFFEKKYAAETVCEPTLEAKDFVYQNRVLNPECTLNHANAKGASILLTWMNFGCGSSREHAVYALCEFDVIIGSAPAGKSAFADIFRDNCRQNLIWTPVVSPEDHAKIVAYFEEHTEKGAITIELSSDDQTLDINGAFKVSFDIPAMHKKYIMNGKNPFDMAKDQITNANDIIDQWNKDNAKLIELSPSSAL